jgi:hypothetical protein
MQNTTSYIFVVHTNEYAGNFEREMCAFLTGQIGDCEVGIGYIDKKVARKFQNKIEQRSDNGCSRPCSIWPNEAGEYNSVAIFFSKKPSKADTDFMQERSFDFSATLARYEGRANEITILGFELLEETTTLRKIDI